MKCKSNIISSMATQPKVKRITVKYKNPNPLFEKWITEWLEQAEAKGSKMQEVFKNALSTLRKYPLPLDSGRDCIILNGFGKKLCHMLDKKLVQYNANYNRNGDISNGNKNTDPGLIQNDRNFSEISYTNSTNIALVSIENTDSETQHIIQKTKKCNPSSVKIKTYKPANRSGAYAILVVLLKNKRQSNYAGYMTKSEIIEQAKHFCDKSFLKPDAGSHYTAWSSMSTLIRKQLISKCGNPAKFTLTDDGEVVASQLLENVEDANLASECVRLSTNDVLTVQQIKDVQSNREKSNENKVINIKTTEEKTTLATETLIFAPYTFDIILLVDTQETAGNSINPVDDETISELNALNVHFEVRHLKVGDFTWICRERNTKHELILPYIVERKRIDDLGQSIKDGRFHEQKFRLHQCNIQNLIYIIESYKNNLHTGLPISSLMQAAANTLIQDNFQVKFTQNHRQSMQYLSVFTNILTNMYEKKTLINCSKENIVKLSITDDLISLMSFKEFNKGASKTRNFRLREIFARQLLQLRGVSVEKVLAIIEKYPTPRLLRAEYDKLGKQGETLLANIQYGPLKRSIGPVISTSLYQLYTTHTLL